MLFSVVIPVYNRKRFLISTLASVQRQTVTDYEIIIIDDGSSDGTRQYLESERKDVRALFTTNQGPGAARNLGAMHARGEYLAFLDSDDLWFPWTLGIFAQLIESHGRPAILSGKLIEFSDDEQLSQVAQNPLEAVYYPDYFSAASSGFFVGSGMAVLRKENFLRTGGFTGMRINAEDHDLILRMGVEPGFVQVLQPVTLGWRRHEGSATMNFRPTFEGVRHLMEQERHGAYPGGRRRARERRDIILRHVRPAALECLKRGMAREAWELYWRSFGWQAALGRWKFLSGFPVKAAVAGFRGSRQ